MADVLWKPLRSGTATRFLTLVPGALDDQLAATLSAGEPHDTVYEAVSYTWGLPHPEDRMIVNNHTVLIRRNLAECLRYLRNAGMTRCLWVDYLCISQNDLREKQRQVGSIGRIFSSARRVLAWLGSHANNSRLLFEMRSISNHVPSGFPLLSRVRGHLSS